MPITKLRPTFTFTEDRVAALTAQLKAVVPEAFADGQINWDTLREALGEYLEEESAEHFGLTWPGKREARRLAATPSAGALIPQPGLGVNEETTHNLFLEGDNLEVLKLLLKSYAGRVKLIYIDPPYNTGNDFVYPDDYSEPLDAYLRRTGQMDEAGQLLTTNSKAGGRFHSNWLSMMYPRLLLARQLLRDDGVIFVSIDDNEAHHLRTVMDEIFGEENFLANIAWEKRFTRSNNAKLFYSLKDSILLYRGSSEVSFLREPRTEKSDSIYSNPDDDPRGDWTSASYVNPATKEQRPNLVYSIINPFTGEQVRHPTHAWKYEYSEHLRHIEENRLWWGSDGNAQYPRIKIFLSESDGLVPVDLWDYKTTGTTDEGGTQVKDLFDQAVFDNPKPTLLIKRMISIASRSDDHCTILDFFAGSCSTAQAVLEFNRVENRHHQFIVVQLPEPTPEKSIGRREGYPTIADIGRERIRRAIARIKAEEKEAAALPTAADGQLSLLAAKPQAENRDGTPSVVSDQRSTPPDLGFKCYRLDRSQFKPWTPYAGGDTAELETLFDRFESPLVENWQPDALLTEILLLQGFPLDSGVRPLPAFERNRVLRVISEGVAHALTVCLDAAIYPETVAALDLRAQAANYAADVLICLDSALSDEDKLRLADRFNLHVI